MSYVEAQEWHEQIQPFIRRSNETRADRAWDWPAMRQLFPLYQHLRGFRCRPLCINTPDEHDTPVLAGMLMLIDAYPFPRGERPQQPSEFVWFLTAAPAEALVELGVVTPPRLGTSLIDVAVTTSFGLGMEGRTWLHAALEGGDGLQRFYGGRCGMEKVPVGQVIAGRRDSGDGRFWRMDEACAAAFIEEMTRFR